MGQRIDHELLDVGDGRRLDRFGEVVLDRPFPPADRVRPADRSAWARSDARFDRSTAGDVDHGSWTTRSGRPIEPWCIREGRLTLELRLSGSGQVGWFPEAADDRAWIHERASVAVGAAERRGDTEVPAILSLFGYTGGSTLTATAAGARATHVDAARTAVAWARRNADLSSLAERPVRWIADDAVAFAGRERRRGRRYAGVVLDPPTYGHGSGGRQWSLTRDIPGLLDDLAALLEPWPGSFVLLSTHTPGVEPDTLEGWLTEAFGSGRAETVE
ncbi:MAG TPA: class I SAM-dependent methyltransferase, partial [Candidatus Binatia bacterium]|nr:class I SAM-dependent methyltransferase [Candidatus Binatia bacterium]